VAKLSDFFSAIDAIAPDIRQTNLLARDLLLDPSAAFVLISSFDLAKIQEGEAFHDELVRAGYHLRKVIVNRAWPQWTQADAASRSAVQRSLLARGERKLAELHAVLADYHAARRSLHAGFAELLILPEMDDQIVGLAALEDLAAWLVAEP